MKLFIASDIHGSAKYCREMLSAFEREKAGRMLLLGDIIYHGPRNDLPEEYSPREVIALLNARADSILSVRGNCEAEVDQMVLNFPVMAEYALIFEGNSTIFATHGHIWDREKVPPLKPGDVLLCGHTHIPACERLDRGIVYINPGSVSIPKAGSSRGYITLENGVFRFKTLAGEEYDTYKV